MDLMLILVVADVDVNVDARTVAQEKTSVSMRAILLMNY